VKFQIQTDAFYAISAATVAYGGTGNNVGDILTLATTPSGSPPQGASAQLQVTGIGAGGAVTTVSVVNSVPNVSNSPSGGTEVLGGAYFTKQSNPVGVSVTSGSGDNTATFNLTFVGPAPQRVVLTNQEFATMTYIQDVLDPNLMDDQFQEAYVKILAGQVCMALTGDKKLANMKVQEANTIVALARQSDGNEGLSVNDVTPDWLRIRGIDFAEPYSGPYSGMEWGGMWPIFG
jgi:hypothetical protein